LRNTIGNIPVRWYDNYDHVGYDWDAKKMTKPAGVKGQNEIDEFLAKMEDPDYWFVMSLFVFLRRCVFAGVQ
jgi:ribosome biogenesis protein ERB1